MDTKKIMHVKISPHVNLHINEYQARPVRGVQRQKRKKLFQSGRKPFKHYLQEMTKTPSDVKLAGNFSNFGNSPRTFQEIATESRYTNILDQKEYESLVKLSREIEKKI